MASKFIIDKRVPVEERMNGPYCWRLVDADGNLLLAQYGFQTTMEAHEHIKAVKKAIGKFTKTEIAK